MSKQKIDQDQGFGDISKYKIVFKDYKITQEDIDNFMTFSEWPVEAFNKKGKKIIIDLRQVVEKVELLDRVGMGMVLKKYKEKTIRPSEILLRCFKVPKEIVQAARIVKLKQDV